MSSKYYINNWISQDNINSKLWKTTRTSDNLNTFESCDTFVKSIHLLNPIDIIKIANTIKIFSMEYLCGAKIKH